MRKYSARLREAGNPPLEIRIGVNTGEVVVRSIRTDDVHTEYTPIGHSTSLAARMQTLAPTGSIAITEATRKLTEGYFELKSLGPARVKGGVSDAPEVASVNSAIDENMPGPRGRRHPQQKEVTEPYTIHTNAQSGARAETPTDGRSRNCGIG